MVKNKTWMADWEIEYIPPILLFLAQKTFSKCAYIVNAVGDPVILVDRTWSEHKSHFTHYEIMEEH